MDGQHDLRVRSGSYTLVTQITKMEEEEDDGMENEMVSFFSLVNFHLVTAGHKIVIFSLQNMILQPRPPCLVSDLWIRKSIPILILQ